MSTLKLPRGSYWYIQVGPLFYSGKRPLTEQVRQHQTVMSTRVELWGRSYLRGWQPHKPHCRPVLMGGGRYDRESQEITIHTGAFEPTYADSFAGAKQFRRRSQAQTVLEEVTRSHAQLGVVPQIKLHEENTQ